MNENDTTEIDIDYDELADSSPQPENDLVSMDLNPEGAGYDPDDADDADFDPESIAADLGGDKVPEEENDADLPRRATRIASTSEAVTIMRRMGWRVRTTSERAQVLKNFQRAWNLGPALDVDGKIGPLTTAALRLSEARRKKGLPTASAHFSFVEYRCKCGGQFAACQRIWTTRAAIREDERYRKAKGSGLVIASGCRCLGWNTHVGGAAASRHMVGDARDFKPQHAPSWFISRGLYNGLGHNKSDGLVRHGDLGRTRSWVYA